MKKSEIRELLKDGVDWQEDDIEVIVDHILSIIEHVGMLPPCILKETPNYTIQSVNKESGSVLFGQIGTSFKPVNEWEPED